VRPLSRVFRSRTGILEKNERAAQEFLATGKRFTALLFAFNDISAIGAVRAFRDRVCVCPTMFRWWGLMI
jgi:DNA-binding LacI/PurR family transcriptional regulator